MAIINFPDTTGQPTDGSFTYTFNDVLYSWTGTYWAANTQSGFDNRYVEVAGDVMTGDLTVPNLTATADVNAVNITASSDVSAVDVIATGDIQSTSQNGGQIAGFRNALINGDFFIQQRGGSNTTGAVYIWADRWFNRSGSANIQRFLATDIPPFNCQAGVSTGGGLEQRLELQEIGKADRFVGTWTLSYWASEVPQTPVVSFLNAGGSGGEVACTVGLAVSGEVRGTYTHYQHLVTMAAPSASNIMLRVVLIANATAARTGFTGVQFEPGPVATPFEHRPYGTELALCQRYFYRMETSNTPIWPVSIGTVFGLSVGSGAVEMRTTPTAVVDTSACQVRYVASDSYVAAPGVSISAGLTKHLTTLFMGGAGTFSGTNRGGLINNLVIAFDAEL